MARTPQDKAPSSQFYWRDWLADPAVRALTRDERGAYIDILAYTHQTGTPGRMTEEQVRRWAGYSEAEWADHREAIRACFRVTRRGVWLQARTLRDRDSQKIRYLQARKGALATNAARWSSVAQRHDSDTHSDPTAIAPASALESSLLLETSSSASSCVGELNTRSANVEKSALAVSAKNGAPKDPDDLTWLELFDPWFWTAYPRRVGKPAALRAWKAVRPQCQATVDAISDGLERWRESWTEPRFIPHPATWLNQRRWEDQP